MSLLLKKFTFPNLQESMCLYVTISMLALQWNILYCLLGCTQLKDQCR